MKIKRLLTLFLALAMILSLAACASKTDTDDQSQTNSPDTSGEPTATPDDTAEPSPEDSEEPSPEDTAEPTQLIVFAAASLTETVTKIAEQYMTDHPNVTIICTFDSSGTLQTQIEEGADCDLFLSAAQKQMNALDDLGLVDDSTRINLLENKVVLVVPEGNPAGITSYDDIATDKVSLIALGNSDVPVGQYSQEILTNMGIWDAIQSKITFGSNVKEVTTQVSEGAVDCGIVYATDAYSAGLTVIAEAPAGMLKTPVIYPAAVLTNALHAQAAKDFLAFLSTDAVAAIFEEVGFVMAG